MFDLNVDVDDSGNNCDTTGDGSKINDLEDRQSGTEIYSGNSASASVSVSISVSSDVVNADEDPPVTNAAKPDDEDLMYTSSNIDNCSHKKLEQTSGSSGGLITRQFFPVEIDVELVGEEFGCRSISAAPVSTTLLGSHWLNLKVPDPVQAVQNLPVPPMQQAKKSRRGPRSRSSQYRGVTFYRRTGRWESHIWDCGKQVYLGGFDTALAAARAYDRAAIKFRGIDADINFHVKEYEEDITQTKNLSKEEFIHILRRQSTGFSRGSSKYRGVTLHKCGRWEARMGQLLGKKAYDKAAIKCNGSEAVTNFEPRIYGSDRSLEGMNQGSSDNLDLNLCVSTTTDSRKGKDDVQKVDRPQAIIGGQTSVSNHYPLWCNMYPGFTPNFEEVAKANGATRFLSAPASGVSNSTWQMQMQMQMQTQMRRNQGVTFPVPVPYNTAAAASSGFYTNNHIG